MSSVHSEYSARARRTRCTSFVLARNHAESNIIKSKYWADDGAKTLFGDDD